MPPPEPPSRDPSRASVDDSERVELWLVRHGPTEWSESGRHTGRTDIGLTDEGREVARRLGDALVAAPDVVVCSPLRRAVETAELAGLAPFSIDADLVEWDYGEAEGVSTAEMRETVPDWSVWTHPLADGERLSDVAGRADRAIDRLRRAGDDAVVVAHGQFLRIFAARWCGLDPAVGRHLDLGTATLSVLGWNREDPMVTRWNVGVPGSGR